MIVTVGWPRRGLLAACLMLPWLAGGCAPALLSDARLNEYSAYQAHRAYAAPLSKLSSGSYGYGASSIAGARELALSHCRTTYGKTDCVMVFENDTFVYEQSLTEFYARECYDRRVKDQAGCVTERVRTRLETARSAAALSRFSSQLGKQLAQGLAIGLAAYSRTYSGYNGSVPAPGAHSLGTGHTGSGLLAREIDITGGKVCLYSNGLSASTSTFCPGAWITGSSNPLFQKPAIIGTGELRTTARVGIDEFCVYDNGEVVKNQLGQCQSYLYR